MAALQNALSAGDFSGIKRIAHGMKTSLSIMGLDSLLADVLDMLEKGDINRTQIQEQVDKILAVCHEALQEADSFYKPL